MSRTLRVCFMGLFALLLSTSAYAQPLPTTAPSSTAGPARRDPAAIFSRVKDITGELNLTAEQKTKIEAIFEKTRDEMKTTIASMKDATGQEKLAKYREMLANLREQVAGVLDETQKAAFNEKLQAMRQSVNGGGGATTNPTGRGPAAMVQRIQTALNKLDLNEDQKSKIADVFKDMKTQIESIHNDVTSGTLDRQAAQEKIRPLIEDARKKILDQLTEDQAQSLRDTLKAEKPAN